MEQADVSRLEADIAIQFEKPSNPDLIVTRLGRLHVYPFASQDYERTYGIPGRLRTSSTIESSSRSRRSSTKAPMLMADAARTMGLRDYAEPLPFRVE